MILNWARLAILFMLFGHANSAFSKLLCDMAFLPTPTRVLVGAERTETPLDAFAFSPWLIHKFTKQQGAGAFVDFQHLGSQLPQTEGLLFRGMALTKKELVHISKFGMGPLGEESSYPEGLYASRLPWAATPFAFHYLSYRKRYAVVFVIDLNEVTFKISNKAYEDEVVITRDFPATAIKKIFIFDPNSKAEGGTLKEIVFLP